MSTLSMLLTLSVVLGARLALEQTDYFRKHVKSPPPLPLGL